MTGSNIDSLIGDLMDCSASLGKTEAQPSSDQEAQSSLDVVKPSGLKPLKGQFIPSFSMTVFNKLVELPGKAMAVYLLLYRKMVMTRRNPVTLTSAGLKGHGLSRWQKTNALIALEKAGLIRVGRRPKKNPLVTLLNMRETT
jgi:hypothetical protein